MGTGYLIKCAERMQHVCLCDEGTDIKLRRKSELFSNDVETDKLIPL